MDAYVPITQSLTPSLASPANDQPWRMVKGTHTLVWYAPERKVQRSAYSSSAKESVTFFIVNAPEIAGLERLRTFKAWKDNWDAEGGKAPDPDVIDTASKVFSLLSVRRVPQVTLTSDGQPMFAYGAPLRGEVVVTDASKIDYFFMGDDAPSDEDVAFDGSTLPAELLDYIASAA